MCTVHDPRDARISEREIPALLAAGHEVTQAGPFTAFGALPAAGVRAIDLPRAHGRHRLGAWRAARRLLRTRSDEFDIIVIHSPELMSATVGLRHPAIVWDVHEDTAAAVSMKPWLPAVLRRPVSAAVRRAEASAERHAHLLLAEEAYQERFARTHPVVPNTPAVPGSVKPTARGRAVYVGSLTVERGVDDLIEVGRRLAPEIRLDVIGPAPAEVARRLGSAQERGWLAWHGFLPNTQALSMVEGATVGLSLLHDQPNYRHSMPTKLLEYLARGVPFVSTPLPLARSLAQESGGGRIVGFADPLATAETIRELDGDDALRQRMADEGRAWVTANADWSRDGRDFVATLEAWATAAPRS